MNSLIKRVKSDVIAYDLPDVTNIASDFGELLKAFYRQQKQMLVEKIYISLET